MVALGNNNAQGLEGGAKGSGWSVDKEEFAVFGEGP